MHAIMRCLREPVLHFVLLGSLLFFSQDYWAPLLVREQIHISIDQQKRLHAHWLAQTGRRATDTEMAALLRQAVDDEILLREARRLGLHKRDPVVRERLIRNMRFIEQDKQSDEASLLQAALSLNMTESDTVIRRRLLQLMRHRIESDVQVTQSDLQHYFDKQANDLQQPARYSFSQVYLAAPDSTEIATVRLALEQGATPEQLGDVFLLGQRFQHMTQSEIERRLGREVADTLADSGPGSPGRWTGPVASVYGQHFLRLDAFEPAHSPSYAKAGRKLAARLYSEQETAALRSKLNALRSRYRIHVEGTAS